MSSSKLFNPFILGVFVSSVSWILVILYLTKNQLSIQKSSFSEKYQSDVNHIISKNSIENKFSLPNYTLILSDDIGLIKNDEDRKYREEGYKKHAFNSLISKRLGESREIPDTRHKLCKSQSYGDQLPKASIIVCFHNEEKLTLMRTITSIVERTPSQFLLEIILVDDNSTEETLTDEIRLLASKKYDGLLKVLRTSDREGLIRARIYGASHAKAPVLVFLDSHVEVNQGWLEPMLSRIALDRKTVVAPIIDMISPDTFVVTPSPLVRGGFNWGLHFRWDSIPWKLKTEEDLVKPIPSPTMAGGLFAIDKKYFEELGSYDAGMDVWGGENLELSFRVWMCGGRLEIVPCSRVAHIFRKRRPYDSPGGEDSVVKNSLRMAYVWMDDYIEYYLKMRPESRKVRFGDISERLQLRQKLKCNSFEWYLKNVYPELEIPDGKNKKKETAMKLRPKLSRSMLRTHMIMLSGTNLCLQSKSEVTLRGGKLQLARCSDTKRQKWTRTSKDELMLAGTLCLQAGGKGKPPRVDKCHLMGGDQSWRWEDEMGVPLYNTAAGLCLGVDSQEEGSEVTMTLCETKRLNSWDLLKL